MYTSSKLTVCQIRVRDLSPLVSLLLMVDAGLLGGRFYSAFFYSLKAPA
jgi:hypothetical protein